MMSYSSLINYPHGFEVNGVAAAIGILLAVGLALWELVWKALAMWKAAHNNSWGWFIALLIFNTAGILPILYLYVFSQPSKK